MPCAVAHQAPMMDELDDWQLPRCIQCAEDETRSGCWIGRCIVVVRGSSERCEQSVRVRVEGQRSLDHELRLVLCNEAGLYWSSTAERQRGRVRAVLALTNAKMAYASEPLLCSRCQYEPTGAREREGAGPAECERRSGARRCHHTPAAAHAAHPIESRRVVAAREWRSSTRATRAAPEGRRSRLGLQPAAERPGFCHRARSHQGISVDLAPQLTSGPLAPTCSAGSRGPAARVSARLACGRADTEALRARYGGARA